MLHDSRGKYTGLTEIKKGRFPENRPLTKHLFFTGIKFRIVLYPMVLEWPPLIPALEYLQTRYPR